VPFELEANGSAIGEGVNAGHANDDVLSNFEPGDRDLEAAHQTVSPASGHPGSPPEQVDALTHEHVSHSLERDLHVFIAVELP
jgi:hypothetical protein